MRWTIDADQALDELLTSEDITAAELAAALATRGYVGVTADAVAGRIRRRKTGAAGRASIAMNAPTPVSELLTELKPTGGSTKWNGRRASLPNDGVKHRHVLFSDLQIPFADENAVALALSFIADLNLRPGEDQVGILGDTIDAARLSKFGTDPRALSFAEELKMGRRFFEGLRAAAGNGVRIFEVASNHGDRLAKTMAHQMPDLVGVRGHAARWPALSIPGLIGYDELGIEYVGGDGSGPDWFRGYELLVPGGAHGPDLWAAHGFYSRKVTGGSAQILSEQLAASVIVGHCHRLGHQTRTRGFDGVQTHAIEVGSLCRRDAVFPFYMPEGVADWQQGGVVVDEYEDGSWSFDYVRIERGVLTFRGVRWTLNGGVA